MPDDPYALTDLARLADVTPRTIRYYVAQGLLPSPDGAGRAARYSEGHLARLRLIRRLQRDHLPLADIRARLERIGDDDVQAALDAAHQPEEGPTPTGTDATLAFVRGLMARAGVSPRFYDPAPDAASDPTQIEPTQIEPLHRASLLRRVPDEFPLREAPGAEPDPRRPWPDPQRPEPYPPRPAPWLTPPAPAPAPATPAPASAPRSTTGDRSTWERLVITQDVELHVRRPLDRATNKRVDRLARIARELFDEES